MKRCAAILLLVLCALVSSRAIAWADVPAAEQGAGAPVRFNITMDGRLVADGMSRAKLVVHGIDRFGNDAATDFPVTITVANGPLLLREDGVDPSSKAASERVETKLGEHGRVVLDAYATTTSGEVLINALADGVVSGGLSSESFFVEPYAKGAIVVGLATGGVGSVPGDVDGSDIFDNGNSNKGRLALYGTGQIANKTVGTFAYETANRLDPTYAFGQYNYDPNERPYLTYGDDSTRTSDALSQAHFYGQVDRGRDSLTYGEFSAQTGTPSSVGTFQQLVSGVKLHLSNSSGTSSVTVFNASNDVQFGRVVFNPLGLADAGPVLRPNLIVGSDIVTLVALDRRTGAIVSQTQLVRNVDYAIDYASGTMRFINVPLPYDANFNPQVVVIQFQFDGTGTKAQTTGGSGRLTLGTTALEAGYANDANGVSNAVVASQAIHGTLGTGTWLISHASTSGGDPALTSGASLAPTNGDNTHLEASVPIGPNTISALYDNTTVGFDNVFGGFATPGLAEMRVDWERKFGNGSLTTGYDRESDAATGHYQQEFGARYHGKPSQRLSYVAGLQAVSASSYSAADALPAYPYPAPIPIGLPVAGSMSNVPGGSTLQAELGATWQVTSRVSLSADHTFNLGQAVAAVPAQTSAELSYAFPKGRAYVRELWSDGPSYTVPESTADFSALSQTTHATVVGVSRDISPMTSIGSAYVVEETNDGTDAYTTYGVKQRFIINSNLHGDGFLQNGGGLGTGLALSSSILGADQSGFTVWGADLDYDRSDRVRAALSWQDRTGLYSGTVLDLGASGRISSEFALAANINSSRLTDYSADDSRIGLAWRPSGTNRVAALLSFEDLSGQYTTAASDSTQVVTYDQLYRPTPQLELAGRLAYQLDGDQYYAAHTALFGLRAQQRIGPKADVAAEWQTLSTPAIADLAQTAFALEFGYRLGSSLRVATGYNFSGSPDPSLTGRPVRRGVYFTATSTIDRIFGWGRPDDRPVNDGLPVAPSAPASH
jgi:hypothetical protein